jgi:hypothetical protein
MTIRSLHGRAQTDTAEPRECRVDLSARDERLCLGQATGEHHPAANEGQWKATRLRAAQSSKVYGGHQ